MKDVGGKTGSQSFCALGWEKAWLEDLRVKCDALGIVCNITRPTATFRERHEE